MSQDTVIYRPWLLRHNNGSFTLSWKKPPRDGVQQLYSGPAALGMLPLPTGPLTLDGLQQWKADLNQLHGFSLAATTSSPIYGPEVEKVEGVDVATLKAELTWCDDKTFGRHLRLTVINQGSKPLGVFQVHAAWGFEVAQPTETVRGGIACQDDGGSVSLAGTGDFTGTLHPGQFAAFVLTGGLLAQMRSLAASLSPERYGLQARHHEHGLTLGTLIDGRALGALLDQA